MRIAELEIEPDPFGNNRRAKFRARLRAKANLVKQPPTVDPNTGRISQQGSGTIDRNINLMAPDTEPQQPAPKPRKPSGVIIRRSRNFDNF